MEVVLVGFVLVVALGMRVWAGKAYSKFYDELTDEQQKAVLRRAMNSGI